MALDQPTSHHLTELRRQQLFPLAVSYCQTRLSDPLTSAALRSQLKVELAKTYAAQSHSTQQANQQELKEQALALLFQVDSSSGNSQDKFFFDCQHALLRLSFGEAAYWRSKLNSTVEDHKSTLASTTSTCKQTSVFLNDTKQWSSARNVAKDLGKEALLNRAELHALRKQLQIKLAQALLRKNQLDDGDDGSIDFRTASKLLSKLTSSYNETPVITSALLIKAEWELFLKRETEFSNTIQQLNRNATTTQHSTDILALQIRFGLQRNNPLQAARAIQNGRKKKLPFSGELAFLTIKTFLELESIAREKEDLDLADKLHNNVKNRLTLFESKYWQQRSQQLYASRSALNKYGPELQNSLTQSRQLQQHGKPQEAIKQLNRAYDLAQKGNFPELAAELSYRLGLLYYEEKQADKAVKFFQILLTEFPKDEHAAQAHLMIAYCANQLKQPQQVRELLQTHRKIFAESPTHIKATHLLAHTELQAGNFADALSLFRENITATGSSTETVQTMLNCYQKLIDSKELPASQYSELFSMARNDLDAYLEAISTETLIYQVRLRLILIELNLLSLKPSTALTNKYLINLTEPEIFHSPALIPYQSKVIELYARSLSNSKERPTTSQNEFVASLNNQFKIQVYKTLVQQSNPNSDLHRTILSTLESQIDLDDVALTSNDKQQLQIAFSLRLLKQKSFKTAHTKIKMLVETNKLTASESETLASALRRSRKAESLQLAVKIWEQAEQKLNPGSEIWFQARYNQINLHLDLGASQTAQKLYRLTTLLHQFPEGSMWSNKFNALADKLK